MNLYSLFITPSVGSICKLPCSCRENSVNTGASWFCEADSECKDV